MAHAHGFLIAFNSLFGVFQGERDLPASMNHLAGNEVISVQGTCRELRQRHIKDRLAVCIAKLLIHEKVKAHRRTDRFAILRRPIHIAMLIGILYIRKVQLHFTDVKNADQHGYVYWTAEDGKTIGAPVSFDFFMDKELGDAYSEAIFDVPLAQLSACTLNAYYFVSGQVIHGSWEVTFPLENAEK